jgi:hypothetical protein
VALAAFAAVGLLEISMLWTLLVLVPISVALVWRKRA